MRPILRTTVATAALALAANMAFAGECSIDGSGSVRILSNDFNALRIVAGRAAECASDAVEVTSNLTTEHNNIQVAALTVNPATYTVKVLATGSLMPLLNEGLLRPLDDLVAKYGENLDDHQLIRVDGKVVAVAFMVNAQHFVYRADLLEENGIEPPKSYEEMLAAADALRDAGVMEYPILANMKSGWHLGEEFVNMYLGFGGEFFEPGSANLAIDEAKAIAALNMMKAQTERMSPDYATLDTTVTTPSWNGGEGALMTMWGSAISAVIDENGESPDVAKNTAVAGALTVGGGTTPASSLWWDGFSLAANISDEDADASFQVMMHAIAPELAVEHPLDSNWLIRGYQPTPASKGVFETIAAGARPYPMVPYMGFLHTALGANLTEFLQGSETAEQALADVTAAYNLAAKEAGFLK